LKKQTTTKLKLPNGSFTTDQSEIVQDHFYKALYTSNNQESSVGNNDLPLLILRKYHPFRKRRQTILSCKGKVNQTECLKARKDFKNEKSPGPDRLQAEFHEYSWKKLHADTCMYDTHFYSNFAYDSGSLSIFQRRGIITLIPKPNKDTYLITPD